ncbi:MAG: chemotaxis protein CheA [Anaerolineales bacterium]|nr:chemotaxis protein CheA [Anaerolineales bacterium]
MTFKLDITQEELPIFQAEADEQLQILEEGLVRLEKSDNDPELIQSLFRAAHTLKGSSGMIGHKSMVELTHALETVLDGFRKNTLNLTSDLIDVCLDSVDDLRRMCDEVQQGEATEFDNRTLIERFTRSSTEAKTESEADTKTTPSEKKASTPVSSKPKAGHPEKPPKEDGKAAGKRKSKGVSPKTEELAIKAVISPNSIATAARALQLMLVLQDMGKIVSMKPSQEEIESAAPVSEFAASIVPSKPLEDIKKAIKAISELDKITIGDEEFDYTSPKEENPAEEPEPDAQQKSRKPVGEILVSKGVITQEQLHQALENQKDAGPAATLGQSLVSMGFITQEMLDEVLQEQKEQQKAPKPVPAAETPSRAPAHIPEKTVRTSVERLDKLMNLVGELITDRNRIYQIRRDFEARYKGDPRVEVLSETVTHIGRITDNLQAEVMGIRMLPVSNVFNKFPRLVRDLSRKAGKEIDLVMRGEDTELDRSVIEEISDPLIHLLRNSVDHGIETPAERREAGKPERGIILITARHEQGRIIITVEDNGKGIDVERVKSKAIERNILSKADAEALPDNEAVDLIFLSGLSTAKTISDVSGRGVGMDIVRNNIERLNGSIIVDTWPGKGSQFQLVLPLTLAIVPTLLVQVGDATYAIPLVTVTETLRITQDDVQTVNNRPVILLRDHVLPVIRMEEVFKTCSSTNGGPESQNSYVVVVRSGKTQVGLIVDKLIGEQEVVVKSLSSVIGEISGISSAAILGDGQVTLIIDVQSLFKLVTVR